MRYAIVPDQNNALRLAIVIAVAGLALLAMGIVFWRQDLRYSQPTERPQDLVQAPVGRVVELPAALSGVPDLLPNKPLLLHFYNPDCPCSRFNRDHVQWLMNRFGKQVQFVSVVESGDDPTASSGLAMPHVQDTDQQIAKALGVYSTPQAVLLDGQRRLLFRGNFNSSRYCSARQTQYARIAIEAMLQDAGLMLEPEAVTAYGCPLPDGECRDADH
jgi:hypothetical protein